MIQALTLLLEHPVTFTILVLCFLGFIGMTYEFILRLFGRKGMVDERDGLDIEDKDDPPEPSNVPKPDGPDDNLEDEQDYVFNPDWNKDGRHKSGWTTDYENESKEKEKEVKNGL